MKKVYLFPAIAVMAAMTACTKEPVNTTVPEDELVPVQFGLASPNYSVTTKASGGLDQWNNTTLYVYGFDREAADYSNPFINNVAATAASDLTASLDVKDANNNGNPYYYQGSTVYDFYGYHVDDAATPEAETPTPIIVSEEVSTEGTTPLTKGVYIPFTITGTQDLMVAKADPATDVTGATETVTAEQAYSAFAARRGVQPTLTFKHQLARFKFKIVSGSEAGSGAATGSGVPFGSGSGSGSRTGFMTLVSSPAGSCSGSWAAFGTAPESSAALSFASSGSAFGFMPNISLSLSKLFCIFLGSPK